MTMIEAEPVGRQSAAIVCVHVATGGKSIRIAERSAPEDAADSGWQFCCGEALEDWRKAQVWSIEEVLQLEPSLMDFVDLPAEITLTRGSSSDQWEKEAE